STGHAERRWIEPLVAALVRRVHRDAGDSVGNVEGGKSRGDASGADVGREATANGGDAVDLPAAGDLAERPARVEPAFARSPRQLVGVARDEALRDIERRGTVVAVAVEGIKRQAGRAVLRIGAVARTVGLEVLRAGVVP